MKPKKHWKKPDPALIFTITALMILGLVAVSSASVVLSFDRFGHNYYYFSRQIIYALIGFGLIYFISRVDYHFWKKWSKPILLGAGILLAVVLIPGLGFASAGAKRWINTGFFLIQPSEFAKLAIIFYLASWFERKKEAENNFWYGIIPPLIAVGGLVGLVILEPDVGTASMLSVIVLVMLFAAGTKLRYLAGFAAAGFAALWLLVKIAPYRAARLVTFFDPSVDPLGIGYHINQALLAIGSGGFWGYGYGDSRQKHNYLPEPIGDSVFAVIAEELGLVRIFIILLLFLAVAVIGMRIAKNAPDRFGQLVAIGIAGWIFFQAFINIGAISGVLPLTGISLPFISYGGSSLLALSIGVGVLLNISRQKV